MNVLGYFRVVGFLVVASFALPVSAQVEEVSEPAPEVEAAVETEAVADAEVVAEAEVAEETETWTTPKRNQVFFRGAYSRLSNDRGTEVFTDTAAGLGAGAANDDQGNRSYRRCPKRRRHARDCAVVS